MSLIDKIKGAFGSGGNSNIQEFEKITEASWKQCFSKDNHFWYIEIKDINNWPLVKSWPDRKKIEFIHWLVPEIHRYMAGRRSWSSADKDNQKNIIYKAFLQALFRNKLVMEDDDIEAFYRLFVTHKINGWSALSSWPVSLLLKQVEQQRKGQQLSHSLRETLDMFKRDIAAIDAYHGDKERLKMIEKIDSILFISEAGPEAIKPVRFMGEDQFAGYANQMVDRLPSSEKAYWFRLLSLAQKASGSKPSTKYLDATKTLIKDLGVEKFKKIVHEWLQFLASLKENVQNHAGVAHGINYNYNTYEYLTAVNADAVKGFVWMCAHFHDTKTIHALSALAERAFRKIPGGGPAAASLGNACLFALFKSKGLDGIGELSKLKLRIKQANTQTLIDKYLQESAKEREVTVHDIEDMAVDDYGLTDGKRLFQFGDYKAELEIKAVGRTEISWFKPDGSPQKSVPATVKEKHKASLMQLKSITKHIEQTLTAQRDRIDRMLRDNRRVTPETFKKHYLDHGLMSFLTRKIIWNFHYEKATVQAIHFHGQWIDVNKQRVSLDAATSISLWHPVQASLDEIDAWRNFLVAEQLQQPMKQAYREIYLLTDAEINTRSYSNRMAAHVLRQHQFNTLAKGRGWRYSLMGAYDNGIDHQKASLELQAYNLRAEYGISEVAADGAMNDTGIWNYVSTDQVRFIDKTTNEPVDLVDVPSLVFSEVMRDVDLFVGVASVGNDPLWRDSGGLPAYRDYWTSYSFGELSEVAKNRKQILTTLVPRLKIKDIATIKDKFLVVKGKLRTYKIHIGSTNILMEPNDQYLCIVPDRSQKSYTENLFLPFEGDNGLSIILSKAFLLAEDDKITDSTITSQIKRQQ